jgi:hypothetical protein
MKIENAVRLFIILIVIVFDPLAVALVIAYNSLLNKKDILEVEKPIEKVVEKVIEKPVTVLKEIFHQYKRGTKKKHNPEVADPNLK